jgi:hypothetical protein
VHACSAVKYGYEINGVLVADFVYPAWFESFRGPSTTKFDHAGRISAPFQVLEGGYTMFLDTEGSAGVAQGGAAGPQAKQRAEVRHGRASAPRLTAPPAIRCGGISDQFPSLFASS